MADLKKVANVAVQGLNNMGVGTQTATTIVSGAAHFAKGVVNIVKEKKDKIVDTVKEISKDLQDENTNGYEKLLNVAEDLGADKSKVHKFIKDTMDDPTTPIKTVIGAVKDEVHEIKQDSQMLKQAQGAGMSTADAQKYMNAKHPEVKVAKGMIGVAKIGAETVKRVNSSKKTVNVNAVVNQGNQLYHNTAYDQGMVME